MLSSEAERVAAKAKVIYREKYQASLEASSRNEFVCIEPESGDYFLGATFDDAVNKAIDAYPDRLTHTLRIGHSTALHLGALYP